MESSSQPFAGVGVADRQREQRETENEQDQVEHGESLSVAQSLFRRVIAMRLRVLVFVSWHRSP